MTERSIPPARDDLAAWHPNIPEFARCSIVVDEVPQPLHPLEEASLPPRAVHARRKSFRLGRSAAHAALASIGHDAGPILVGQAREPVWPPGVMGSISHTTDVGIALVAPESRTDGVGVDVEQRRHAPELANRVPRDEERAWLDNQSSAERDDALLALFSAKETIFKAFFPTVRSYFGFEAALLEPTISGYVGRLVEPVSEYYPPDRLFDLGCTWLGSTVVTWLVLPKTKLERAGERG